MCHYPVQDRLACQSTKRILFCPIQPPWSIFIDNITDVMSSLAKRRPVQYGSSKPHAESLGTRIVDTESVVRLKTSFLDHVRRLYDCVYGPSDIASFGRNGKASGVFVESWVYGPSGESYHVLTQLKVHRSAGEGKLYFTPISGDCAIALPVVPLNSMSEFDNQIVPLLFRLYHSSTDCTSEDNHMILNDIILAPTESETYDSVAVFPDSCRGLLYGIQVHLRYKGSARLAPSSATSVPFLVLDHIVLDIDCLFNSPIPPAWPVFYSAALAKTIETPESRTLAADLETVYKQIDGNRLADLVGACAEKVACQQPYITAGDVLKQPVVPDTSLERRPSVEYERSSESRPCIIS